MNKETTNERPRGSPTGKQYDSIYELMDSESIPQPVKEKVTQLIGESKIATKLAQLRHLAGISQQKMGEALNMTQGNVSKIENSRDDDLTLKQIKEYARVTGERISVMFGKPLTHVQAVQLHAMGLKSHLEELAKIADDHEEMESEIRKFFAEAFVNLFQIMALCNNQLPAGGSGNEVEIKFQLFSKELPQIARKSTLRENPRLAPA
jgi:transcriptional regulator with XRE-family HTH domain